MELYHTILYSLENFNKIWETNKLFHQASSKLIKVLGSTHVWNWMNNKQYETVLLLNICIIHQVQNYLFVPSITINDQALMFQLMRYWHCFLPRLVNCSCWHLCCSVNICSFEPQMDVFDVFPAIPGF